MKYIIVRLDHAKEILNHLPEGEIKERFASEEGADIQDIVTQLQRMNFCHTCIVESQENYCKVLLAKRLGRRLRRLLERADS